MTLFVVHNVVHNSWKGHKIGEIVTFLLFILINTGTVISTLNEINEGINKYLCHWLLRAQTSFFLRGQ